MSRQRLRRRDVSCIVRAVDADIGDYVDHFETTGGTPAGAPADMPFGQVRELSVQAAATAKE